MIRSRAPRSRRDISALVTQRSESRRLIPSRDIPGWPSDTIIARDKGLTIPASQAFSSPVSVVSVSQVRTRWSA